MAEAKKNTVTIRLRVNPDPRAPQEEFYSFNFKNYIIKRGVDVDVPVELAEMIRENEEAADFAIVYANSKALKTPKA